MTPTKGGPPHNSDAEENLIGAMLVNGEAALAGVAAVRDGSRFYSPGLALIFDAVAGLTAAGKVADVVTVGDLLEYRGQLEKVGGKGRLLELTVATTGTGPKSMASYVGIVLRDAELRDLAHAGLELADTAKGGDLDATRRLLDNIIGDRTDSGPGAAGLAPIDVGAIMLAGTPAATPELLRRTDGRPLIVRPGVTVIHGVPGAGKSFLAAELVRQALVAGETVAVADYEGSELTWAERLTEFGLEPEVVSEQLVYLRPGATP